MAAFALFADLENCGGKKSMLMDVIERVKIRGDILIGKVYGYTDSYSDLKETLLSNTFAVVPSLRYGRSQKNSMDIQLVIDALDIAYTNPLIDSFCIVSACSEFQFLESVSTGKERTSAKDSEEALSQSGVNDLIVTVLRESESGEMLAAELKNVLLRLRPNFSEKSVGFSTFGKLVAHLSQQFGAFTVTTQQHALKLSLVAHASTSTEQINKDNYVRIFKNILEEYKNDGFLRVNPSILKAAVLASYPDFTERTVGHRRFSDVLRALEKEGLLRVETDDGGNMLVRIR